MRPCPLEDKQNAISEKHTAGAKPQETDDAWSQKEMIQSFRGLSKGKLRIGQAVHSYPRLEGTLKIGPPAWNETEAELISVQ